MCGRARLAADYTEIKRRIGFGDRRAAPNLRPTWNLAPTQDILTARREDGERAPVKMHWGLIPAWSKEAKMKYPTFNAKAETVASLASFRSAWKAARRCLVIVDGFYEWKKLDAKTKQPYAIGRADGDLTVMAGLWEDWKDPAGGILTSCTVITTEANADMEGLHNRMPVILEEKDWPAWLGETDAPIEDIAALMAPAPAGTLVSWKVDSRVGNVRNNDAACAAPIDIPLFEIDGDNELQPTGKRVPMAAFRVN